MLPVLIIQGFTVFANLVMLLFIWYYLWEQRVKEKQLEKEINKYDSRYHHVVDDALAKERQIIEDASSEAGKILSNAEFFKQASADKMTGVLKTMESDIEGQTLATTQVYTDSYHAAIQKLASASLGDFQNITKQMATDLEKQLKEYRVTMLPRMDRDLEEYKKGRMKDADEAIIKIIKKASVEIFNKAIPIEDHHNLIVESLEKAKKEGLFD
jgi:vacuolar-type H+-ATPase subunit H